MSHFTKCQTKVTQLAALRTALDQLGLKYQAATDQQGVTVRGYQGQTLTAELSINMGKYDVGVVRAENGTYEFVADWWGVETTKGVSEEEFKNTLSQKYQYHNVKQACEDKGYAVEEEVNEEDGSIRLVVRKWVSE